MHGLYRLTMPATCQRIVLASRPRGTITPENFRLETIVQPAADSLLEGEVLVKNRYLSIDPYMRGRMSAAKSYAPAQQLDQTMVGETAGTVLASRFDGIRPGDQVVGRLGWTEMGVVPGDILRRVDADTIPLSNYLGAVGMPGVTAWYGINVILNAQPGQTLVVSAAAGAVGSVVGQLAKRKGCRVVGIAGGEQKCRYVVEQLGFDGCIDYRQSETLEALQVSLQAAVPDGVDLLFENVGSTIFDASLACLNPHAKIALCGMVAAYNGGAASLVNAGKLLTMRATLQGFIITEHPEIWPQALEELAELVGSGLLQCHETMTDGLASAPMALIGMLQGQNLGKQLIKLSD